MAFLQLSALARLICALQALTLAQFGYKYRPGQKRDGC